MSEPIATWLQGILPNTPGCSRAVAKRAFVDTCREFFRRSTYWHEVLTNIDVVAATADVVLTPTDASSHITQIDWVTYNGVPLRKLVSRPAESPAPTGTPTSWYTATPGVITLWPTPEVSVTGALSARVFLNLVRTATELPDLVFNNHYDTLLDGVLGRLYSHPAKPYSNPALGTYHLKRFNTGIAMASAQRKQGGVVGQDWVFPSYDK